MWHRRSLIPNLASSDLRISEGWLLLQLIMVLPLIWSTGWVCWYALQRSLTLMIIMTVEGQWPRFVGSTTTNWTLRSPPKMNYTSHIINVAVQVNAGWQYKDSPHRLFRFIFFALAAAELIISLERSLPVVDIGSRLATVVLCVCSAPALIAPPLTASEAPNSTEFLDEVFEKGAK